jgi:penicillin-binding protein 1C
MSRTILSRLGISALIVAAVAGLGYAAFEVTLARLCMPDLSRASTLSPVVLSEDGHILATYLAADGRWQLKSSVDDVPAHFVDILLAYEDKRFFAHRGVDPLAALRAAYLLLRHGRVVSGASTITMQTVRLLDDRRESGLLAKLHQAMLAIELERQLDKQQILSLYLTVAPFGGNIEGVRAASLQYFGKEPRMLSIAEAAYLVALPQSPERRRPGAAKGAGRKARDEVLSRMKEQGVLSVKDVATAISAPVPVARGRYPTLARHLGDRLRKGQPDARTIRTLIDYDLQRELETLAASVVAQQPDAANAALLVIRNRDMAVRAYVGGAAYFDATRAGMYDLVRGVRSPGSALKPVIYGLAFEDLIVHPNTIVNDDNLRIRGYAPANFDNTYRGDITTREALIQSVNTIAVMLLEEVGADRFLTRLRNAGVVVEMPEGDTPPGLAIALGGVGISLEQLATLYAGIANGGVVRSLRYRLEDKNGGPRQLMAGDAAWAVADSLADSAPPQGRSDLLARDGGRRIAFKTGTSYGFRDAWAVGFDADYTVAVWIGRPDGDGRLGGTGAKTAVPIMMRVFDLLPNAEHDVAANRPTWSILAKSGELPLRLQRHIRGNEMQQPFDRGRPLEIGFPVNGAYVKLEERDGAYLPFSIFAVGGRAPFQWYVDGKTLQDEPRGDRFVWKPEGRGQVEFLIVDAEGRTAKSTAWFD